MVNMSSVIGVSIIRNMSRCSLSRCTKFNEGESIIGVCIPITENRIFTKKWRTLGTIRMCAYCI